MPRENRCQERKDAKREKMPRENRENRVEKSRMLFLVPGAVFGEVGV